MCVCTYMYGVRYLELYESCDQIRCILHGVRRINLQPPTSFLFSKSEEWSKCKWQFKQYCHASGLVDKDEICQVGTLLYCLGEEAKEILDTTCISADRDQPIMLIILPIMLCCTAQKVHLLCLY